MANSDETSGRFKGKKMQFTVPKSAGNIFSMRWYIANGRYPVRDGNVFKPYFSGQEVFEAIASSIRAAKKSVDIVTWGFDPAIQLKRDEGADKHSYVQTQENFFYRTIKGKDAYPLREIDRKHMSPDDNWGIRKRDLRFFSPWRREEAYGEVLLDALRKNKNLNIRIVLWRMPINANRLKAFVQNATGLEPWPADVRLKHEELYVGFEESKPEELEIKRKYNIPNNSLDLETLLMRDRHPDAQTYSKEWFERLLYEKVPKGEDDIFDRIAVVFRNIGAIATFPEEDDLVDGEAALLRISDADHQKCVLIDVDDTGDKANPHGYIMGHNSMTNYWSAFPFEHLDQRNEMDWRPYHDFSLRVEGPLLIDLSKNFCDAWGKNRTQVLNPGHLKTGTDMVMERVSPVNMVASVIAEVRARDSKLAEEDKYKLGKDRDKLYPNLEKIRTGGSSRGQIVRTRVDEKIDGYKEKEIKDAYLQATRMSRNYMFIVNQYLQYPKLFRHVKYWWIKYKDTRQMYGKAIPEDEALYLFMGTARPERGDALWRAQQMANEMGCGDQFPFAEDELYIDYEGGKENLQNLQKDLSKRTYGDPYGFSAPLKELKDIRSYQRDLEQVKKDKEASIAHQKEIDRLTAQKEAERQAEKKQQKVFQKNVEGQDSAQPTVEEQLQKDGNKIRTPLGMKMASAVQVPKSEIDGYQIKPLFFMYYTKIPGGGLPEDNAAQQPYVHAKLYVQDDTFFTLGSANLNIRSMAADSELNVISDDGKTAIEFRQYLWEKYTGYPGEKIEREKEKYHKAQGTFTEEMEKAIKDSFPNDSKVLGQKELGKIYSAFVEVLEKNQKRLGWREVIQGCIAPFADIRSADAYRVG